MPPIVLNLSCTAVWAFFLFVAYQRRGNLKDAILLHIFNNLIEVILLMSIGLESYNKKLRMTELHPKKLDKNLTFGWTCQEKIDIKLS